MQKKGWTFLSSCACVLEYQKSGGSAIAGTSLFVPIKTKRTEQEEEEEEEAAAIVKQLNFLLLFLLVAVAVVVGVVAVVV